MGVLTTLIAASALAGPPAQVSTFTGGDHQGELITLTATELTLSQDGTERKIPLKDVMEVRFPATNPPETGGEEPPVEVRLTDGSRLQCQSLTSSQRTFTMETLALGKLELPADSIGSVRLAPLTTKVADAWTKLLERRDKSDLLVIPKNNLLDHLSGVVGAITEEQVKFLLGNNEVPVNRAKVFGVVYGNRQVPSAAALCRAVLANQDAVQLKSLTWKDNALVGELVAGASVTLPAEKLQALDFSLGKVTFLADLEPRQNKLTLPQEVVGVPRDEIAVSYYQVKFNQNFSGYPFNLGNKIYTRGLCIHSKTELAYRLGGESRRFQAVMGIDRGETGNQAGDVHVTIRADGKPLLESIVRGPDAPRELDLDVSNVILLEIIVDFVDREGELGTNDHLVLADAKLIK